MTTIAALAALVGCGDNHEATVSGVVRIDGKPVPQGTVTYSPSESGSAAYATIDENGYYEVRTGRESGLPPGGYYVTVAANESAARTVEGGPPPPGKLIVPLWYRFKDSSGLQFKVEPGSNEIDLELSSQPPPAWQQRQKHTVR
jgi:hypothetical protein